MTNPYSMPQSELTEPVSNETYDPKFFALKGRIGRVRYLAYSMGAGLLMMPLMLVLIGGAGALAGAGNPGIGAGAGMLGMLAFYALSFAVTFILARRRLNDMGKTGWLGLLMLIPFVNFFVFLWFVFGPGDAQSNEYGPPPGPNTTGTIIMACILPLFFIIGIVAAVSIPAYQAYTQKAVSSQVGDSQ